MTRVTFFGDAFIPETYVSRIGDIGNYVFNLEFPITQSTRGYPGKINLKAENNYIKSTFGNNPVAVCLANNHISDYGEDGLNDTLSILREEGIKYFGAGAKDDYCNNPALVQSNGLIIALIGYVCSSTSPLYADDLISGVLPVNLKNIARDIKKAKTNGAHRVVVSLHWGAEEVRMPKPEDIKIARQLVDSGADLIIGHHAHHIQPYEKYKNKYIFYGLGNLIFPNIQVDSYFDGQTGKPSCVVEKKMKYWNKRSLAVSYDPISNEASYRVLHFDRKVLKIISKERKCADKQIKLGRRYDKQFHRTFVWCKIKNVIFNYLISPKCPRFRHIKGIVSITKSEEYK